MKFVLKPSLEHMALVKIVISLWSQNDVKALIAKFNFRALIYEFDHNDLNLNEKWVTIEENVIKKVTHLPLPQLLKERVLGVIKPIGVAIFMWMMYNHSSLNVNLPVDLYWTQHGTIDKKRTAEVLVKHDILDIFTRYKIACLYCLEDDVIRFWNRLPEDLKESDSDESSVISFWSDNMKREGAGHISYKVAFYCSVLDSNRVAAEYFLQKLSPQEREDSLEELAISVEDANRDAKVLCFLLPEMEEEEQKKVLKNFPVSVLQCFLQWPMQSFFIGVANCMWDFLSTGKYEEILIEITIKVREGYKDYNYQKLFREFWQESPNALKDSVVEEIDNGWLLQNLCDMKDEEIIRLILKDATPMEKEKLIYSNNIAFLCQEFISDNEWDNLEFFIRECLQSKNEMLKFKKEFEKRTYFQECSATIKHKWKQLFCSFDDSICNYGKRGVEDRESSSSKRFQSIQ